MLYNIWWLDEICDFHDGYARVRSYSRWNFINTKGKFLWNKPYDEWFDEIDDFYNGYAIVRLNDKYNFINTNYELVWNKPVNQWFDRVDDFHDGYAKVHLFDSYFYYLSSDGVLIDPTTANPLSDADICEMFGIS